MSAVLQDVDMLVRNGGVYFCLRAANVAGVFIVSGSVLVHVGMSHPGTAAVMRGPLVPLSFCVYRHSALCGYADAVWGVILIGSTDAGSCGQVTHWGIGWVVSFSCFHSAVIYRAPVDRHVQVYCSIFAYVEFT